MFQMFFYSVQGSPINCHYSYDDSENNGPSNWGKRKYCPNDCDGRRQSPINIDWTYNQLKKSNLKIIGDNKRPIAIEAENTGHMVVMKFIYHDGKPVRITGGPLGDQVYYAHSFHDHWGTSEHAINGARTEAELHIVHINEKHKTLSEALKYPDGAAVLGFHYKLVDADDDDLKVPYASILEHLIEPYSKHTLKHNLFSYRDLYDELDFNVNVASYEGSLTSPPCQEAVIWMVSNKVLPITAVDLEALHSIINSEGEPIENNARPLQNQFNRTVTFYNH